MERLKEQFKLLKFTTYKHCGPYGTDITICDVPSYPHSTRYRVKGVNTSKVPTAIQCPGCNYVLDQKKLGEHICRPSPRQYKKQCQGVVPCSKCPPVCYVTQRALDLHNYLHKASFLLYCWMCRVAHEDNQCPNLFNCQDCKAFVLNDAQALV
jgi:hypothetical protein